MKKRLKEVCEFYSGTGFPIKYQGDSYGDLPFYKVSDIANNEIMGNCFLDVCNNYISYDTVREIKGTVIPRNVVVFAKIGEALKLNRRCITSSDCLIDNNVMGIGCNEKYLDIKYFYFFMKNLKIEKLAESTTVPSVRKTKLEELFIEVPNMELQLEIARTLEVIQDIILYRQKQLMQMDKLIKARFVELFGYPLNSTKGWLEQRLGECCVINPKKNTDNRLREDLLVSFIPMASVSEKGDILKLEDKFYRDVKNGFTYFCDRDVLFAKITPCMENGKGAVAVGLKNGIGFGSTEFHVLRPIIDKSNSYWLYTLTSFEIFRKKAEKNMTGSAGQKRVPASFLENIQVSVPPINIQNEFEKFVIEIEKSKVEVQKALDKAQLLFDSLMQKYFG